MSAKHKTALGCDSTSGCRGQPLNGGLPIAAYGLKQNGRSYPQTIFVRFRIIGPAVKKNPPYSQRCSAEEILETFNWIADPL